MDNDKRTHAIRPQQGLTPAIPPLLPLTPDSPGCQCPRPRTSSKRLFSRLSLTDRLLTPAILLSMIVGVLIGEFVPGVQAAFDTARFRGVSAPIAIGLLVMIWPILAKVRYEALPVRFSRRILAPLLLSLFLNWIVGPLLMLGLAWAALPDLPAYRTGVILVGLARCIAMVMVWTALARGDAELCAVLVVVNSVLQVVLYAPLAVLFVNVIGGEGGGLRLAYGDVAISVLIYLGIPLVAGVATRYAVQWLSSKTFLEEKFLPKFGLLSLLGLLYTILVMFAYQGHAIIHNLGPVFRTAVPLVAYFILMWTSAFWGVYRLGKRAGAQGGGGGGYEMAVVQSFTAASNNFELAIAVAIAVYGVDSKQALAATIGPLVEVPVLLALTWVALYLREKLVWADDVDDDADAAETDSEKKKEMVDLDGKC